MTHELAGGIGEIALCNGPLNLVDKALLPALNTTLARVEATQDVRCVIVHGGGARAFCAGSDAAVGPCARQGVAVHRGHAFRGCRVGLGTRESLVDGSALSMSTRAQQIFESDDLHDGVAAFLAKRAPQFKGR